jgi:hypothetical protein
MFILEYNEEQNHFHGDRVSDAHPATRNSNGYITIFEGISETNYIKFLDMVDILYPNGLDLNLKAVIRMRMVFDKIISDETTS